MTAGVLLDADPERVWRLAVDWPRQREWILGTRTEGGQGVGAAVTGRTGIGPVGFTDPMVITDWDPPRRCVVSHRGRLVRGEGEFEVARLGCRSQLLWTERIVLPRALGRLAYVVIGRVTRLGLGWSLRRFARLLGS